MKKITTLTTAILALAMVGGCDRKDDDKSLTSGKSVEEAKEDVSEARQELTEQRKDQAAAREEAAKQDQEAAAAKRNLDQASATLMAKIQEVDKNAQARMRDIDAKADALRKRVSGTTKLDTEDRKDIDNALARLSAARGEIQQALSELRSSTEANYEELSDRVGDRLDDMHKAYEDAADELD